MLDYLGVPAEFRNQGIGAIILKDIRNKVEKNEFAKSNHQNDGSQRKIHVILESETPEKDSCDAENVLRTRRCHFYERNGYIKIYEMGTCGVRFNAMSFEIIPDNLDKVMKEHKKIYGSERTDVIIPLPSDQEPPLPFWMK